MGRHSLCVVSYYLSASSKVREQYQKSDVKLSFCFSCITYPTNLLDASVSNVRCLVELGKASSGGDIISFTIAFIAANSSLLSGPTLVG